MSGSWIGTRTTSSTSLQGVNPPTEHFDRSVTRDPGKTKLVRGALTFTSAPPRVTFAGLTVFAVKDTVLIGGSALNNGVFAVTFVDPGGLYLTLSPPPKPETTPATATMQVA